MLADVPPVLLALLMLDLDSLLFVLVPALLLDLAALLAIAIRSRLTCVTSIACASTCDVLCIVRTCVIRLRGRSRGRVVSVLLLLLLLVVPVLWLLLLVIVVAALETAPERGRRRGLPPRLRW